jgi:CHAT domain-containing protein
MQNLFRLLFACLLALPSFATAQVAARADSIAVAFALRQDFRQAPQAYAIFERLYARDLAECRRDSLTAVILSGLGEYALLIDGNHYRSARFYRSALELADSLYTYPHDERVRIGMSLAELYQRHEPKKAATMFRELLKELQAMPKDNKRQTQGIYWNLARNYTERGEYQPAIDAIELALAGWRKSKERIPLDGSRLYNQQAQIFNRFGGEAEAALTAANTAFELAEQAEDPYNLAFAFHTLGYTYLINDRLKEAEATYQEMRELVAATPQFAVLMQEVKRNLSEVNLRMGNAETALRYADETLREPEEANRPSRYLPLLRRAAALEALGRYDEAIATVNTAIEVSANDGGLLKGDLRRFSPDSIFDYDAVAQLLDVRASALIARGRLRDALADYQLIFATQETRRRQGQDPVSRRMLSNDYRKYYDKAITLLYSMPNRTAEDDWAAFRLSDASRNFSLLADLRDRRRQRDEAEAALRETIASYERIERPTSGERQYLASQRDELQALLLRQNNTSGDVEEVSFDLQAYLVKTGATVLELYASDDAYFAFSYQENAKLTFHRIGERRLIDSLAVAWRQALEDGAYRKRSLRQAEVQKRMDEQFQALGEQLYELFCGALDVAGSSAFTVITDGALHFLPFGALVAAPSNTEGNLQYADLQYLAEIVPLRYAYSLRHLHELTELPERAVTTTMLAVAPSFVGEAGALYVARSLSDGVGLRPLTNNLAEATAVAKLIPGAKLLSGREATREAFFQEVEGARLIHLASHGAVNTSNPNRSYVAFTQPAEQIDPGQLLYFNDLTTLNLAADLVTLSACETSLGAVAPSEQVLSMGVAFAAAGARATVSSLWPVDDAATTELMVKFYEALAAGKSKSVALASAQRYLRTETEYAHPYYWAAFSLHGADEPSRVGGGAPWWLYGLAGLSLLALALFAFRQR